MTQIGAFGKIHASGGVRQGTAFNREKQTHPVKLVVPSDVLKI
jgi:hypothetical protein